jgi:hypothetical protein
VISPAPAVVPVGPRAKSRSRYYPGIWAIFVAAIFFSSLFSIFGESRDWSNYDESFDALRIDGLESDLVERFELGFKYVVVVLTGFPLSNIAIYSVIAGVSALLKCVAINSVSPGRVAFLMTLAFYFCCFAALHELTQIRAAVAIAFLFVAYACLLKGRFFWMLTACASSIAFHFSAALVVILLLSLVYFRSGVARLTLLKAIIFGLVSFVGIAFAIELAINLLDEVFLVFQFYQAQGFGDDKVNPLSVGVLLNLAIVFSGLIFWGKLTLNMRQIMLLQLVGVAVFYATIEFPVFAHRFSEMIRVFWVFFFAEAFKSDAKWLRYASITVATMSSLFYGYGFYLSGQFFN